MKKNFTILMLLAFCCLGMNAKTFKVKDVITGEALITQKEKSGEHITYESFDNYSFEGLSGAVYEGMCGVKSSKKSFMIDNFDYPNRGFVTTTSNGIAKSITFYYGNGNTYDTSAVRVFADNTQPENLVHFYSYCDEPWYQYYEFNEQGGYTFEKDYKYIGFVGFGENLSYLSKVEVVWNVTDNQVAVPVGAAGISTFSFEYDLDFSGQDNVTAWVATLNDAKDAIILKKVTKVPAHTGVIVEAEPNSQYRVDIIEGATLTDPNDLIGVSNFEGGDVEQYEDNGNTNYLLVRDGEKVSFRPLADNYTHKIQGRKAYLSVDMTSAASMGAPLRVEFDDEEVTGIEAVNCEEVENGDVYNLQGITVDSNYKGFVIKNGKKFFNR